ncbi:MAG: LamG-like jellyroll fold domain-containing protein [Acidobacteriota bacterium]
MSRRKGRELSTDLLWLGLACALALGLSWRTLAPPPASAPPPPAQALGADHLGDGFVIWESSRDGSWRLWLRQLDGSGLRPVTPPEPGRSHCCPHVSPSGKFLAYLSFLPQAPSPRSGELRLLELAGGGQQVIATARVPSEHRVAVWRSDDELIYMGPEGRARRWRRGGESDEILTPEPPPDDGWLLDATLSYGTTGYPTFSPFDERTRRITPRPTRAGCQPYFARDGQWGFWVAGAGGPIKRLDLASGAVSTLLDKGDDRLPRDRGYLYFPMVSGDQSLLAWGASGGDHAFHRADYDIFVAELAAGGQRIRGEPIRLTRHPAPDRYPEIFRRPLELGRHRGEAPWTIAFGQAGEEVWEWDFGDGQGQRDALGRHRYEAPGVYQVVARREGEERRGVVEIVPAAPPRVLALEQRSDRRLRVRFDEPVKLSPEVRVELASGRAIAELKVTGEDHVLEITLVDPLESADRLRLVGVEDLASPSNRLAETRLVIPAPRWPATDRGLQFLWESSRASNRVPDPAGGPDRSFELEARGLARLDHGGTLRPSGGFFASANAGRELRRALQRTQRFTVELTFEPPPAAPQREGVLLALGEGGRAGNLALRQRGDELFFELRTGRRDRPPSRVALGAVAAGTASHLAVTFEPGRLQVFRDGRFVEAWPIEGDFFHWRDRSLQVGQGWGGSEPWRGRLWGVAFWDRVLSAEEVTENWRRRPRPEKVSGTWVTAELMARSTLPTLAEIAPYDRALAVFRYRPLEPTALGSPLRVAHWVLLDGEETPEAAWLPGRRVRLWLERWPDNSQLEGRFLADTLTPGELFFAAPEPLVSSPAGLAP